MPKSRSLRLNSTQLNNLNLSYLVKTGYMRTDETIESNPLEVSYEKVSKDEASICVFHAVSDMKKPRQNLAYINDVIQQFEQKNPGEKTTLLIPLMQSRLWKDHCILVEVTITNDKKQIHIHDSQSWWGNLFYPNCLKDLKKQGYQVEYTSYGKQKDSYSCVYFVYQFIQKILGNNVKKPIKKVLEKSKFDSLKTLKNGNPSEKDPIGKLINDNFKEKYSDIRKIESGETISWEKETFENCLKKKNTQESDDIDIEFPDDNVEDTKTIKLHESKGNIGISFFQIFSNLDANQEKEVQNLTCAP